MIRHLGSSLTDVTDGIRRADHRPAPSRHPADERPAARRRYKGRRRLSWSMSRRRSRLPTTSSILAPSQVPQAARWSPRAPSRGRGPAAPSLAAISTTGPPQGGAAQACRHATDPRRDRTTCATSMPHSAGRAGGRHRRAGSGKLADPWIGRWAGRRGGHRPDSDPRLPAEQPGDVHRTARPDPPGVRAGHGVKPALFSANSRPHAQLQRRRRHLHRAGHHGHRRIHCEVCDGKRSAASVARVRVRRAEHCRGACDVGDRGRGVLR